MPYLLAFIIAFPAMAGPASTDVHSTWQITRSDYREFCAGDKTTINLNTGMISASIGACDPNRDGAPESIKGRVRLKLLSALRRLTKDLQRSHLIDPSCEQRSNVSPNQPQVLSGPSRWVVDRGSASVLITFSTPCLTPVAKTLIADVEDAVRGLNNGRLQ